MTTEISNIQGTTEAPKETLRQDFKAALNKADHLLKDVGHTVAEEFAATRSAMTENACGAASATDAYVRANPWKIVGIAAAAGALIGAVISRR